MNTLHVLARTTSTALLAIALATGSAGTALAHQPGENQETLIDRTATGSIATRPRPDCSPADPRRELSCQPSDEQPPVGYPSAPVNPAFGL
ncbi:hypothetical protein [Oricola cellulosilytica]|uniref:Uncharacterized protein n=1 Tax=Oricola cellulosilytica TaxID=1429082 RepID=A0A4R0PC46_9HYPH|nr:hypothetical protein [Oricola cellulosilytica]TCD15032.1 hypothetical protein E0D97_05645 [Oricola cellulosilytica]